MDMDITKLILLATVTEAATEYVFSGIPRLANILKWLSALVGMGVAVLFQADLFLTLGIESVSPLASQLLTGIIISRGSNLLNTLLQSVYKLEQKL